VYRAERKAVVSSCGAERGLFRVQETVAGVRAGVRIADLAVFWWWGGFNAVNVTETVAGPYRYAYLDYEGPISNMRKSQIAALDRFTDAHVTAGDTISVILTDPRQANGKVRAQLGYTLDAAAAIPAGLKEGRIERRPVYAARIHAAVLLAPSKAYQALDDMLEPLGKGIVMPTVELYRPAGRLTGLASSPWR